MLSHRRHKIDHGSVESTKKPEKTTSLLPIKPDNRASAFQLRFRPTTPLPKAHLTLDRSDSIASSTSLASPSLLDDLEALTRVFGQGDDEPLKELELAAANSFSIGAGFDELEYIKTPTPLDTDDNKSPDITATRAPYPPRKDSFLNALLLNEISLTVDKTKNTSDEFTH